MSDTPTSELRAVAHPLRLRMLSLLTSNPMSAAEVARELEVTHANASYHLRQLAQAGLLEEAGQETIRGGTAQRYRYAVGHAGPRDGSDPMSFVTALFAELRRRTPDRIGGPGMTFDLESWVDPAVWRQAVELMNQASMLLHDNARPPRTEGTVHVSASGLAFSMDGFA